MIKKVTVYQKTEGGPKRLVDIGSVSAVAVETDSGKFLLVPAENDDDHLVAVYADQIEAITIRNNAFIFAVIGDVTQS